MNNRKNRRRQDAKKAKDQKNIYKKFIKGWKLEVEVQLFGAKKIIQDSVPVKALNLYDLLNAGLAVVYNHFKNDNTIVQSIQIVKVWRVDDEKEPVLMFEKKDMLSKEFQNILLASAIEYKSILDGEVKPEQDGEKDQKKGQTKQKSNPNNPRLN